MAGAEKMLSDFCVAFEMARACGFAPELAASVEDNPDIRLF